MRGDLLVPPENPLEEKKKTFTWGKDLWFFRKEGGARPYTGPRENACKP